MSSPLSNDVPAAAAAAAASSSSSSAVVNDNGSARASGSAAATATVVSNMSSALEEMPLISATPHSAAAALGDLDDDDGGPDQGQVHQLPSLDVEAAVEEELDDLVDNLEGLGLDDASEDAFAEDMERRNAREEKSWSSRSRSSRSGGGSSGDEESSDQSEEDEGGADLSRDALGIDDFDSSSDSEGGSSDDVDTVDEVASGVLLESEDRRRSSPLGGGDNDDVNEANDGDDEEDDAKEMLPSLAEQKRRRKKKKRKKMKKHRDKQLNPEEVVSRFVAPYDAQVGDIDTVDDDQAQDPDGAYGAYGALLDFRQAASPVALAPEVKPSHAQQQQQLQDAEQKDVTTAYGAYSSSDVSMYGAYSGGSSYSGYDASAASSQYSSYSVYRANQSAYSYGGISDVDGELTVALPNLLPDEESVDPDVLKQALNDVSRAGCAGGVMNLLSDQEMLQYSKDVQSFSEHLTAASESENAARAAEPIELPTTTREFNEEFQALFQEVAVTPFAQSVRARRLRQLWSEFIRFAGSAAKVIVEELGTPTQLKRIQPLAVQQGSAGGEKFLYQGVFFKFARLTSASTAALYRLEEHVAKAACNEIRAANAIVGCHVQQLHTLLSAAFFVRGYCVVATSLAPISSPTLKMGSDDGGKTVLDESPELRELSGRVGRRLNLAQHPICQSAVQLHMAGDVEGHVSVNDGRLYLVDLARVLPPLPPAPFSKQHLFVQFRPTFMIQHAPVPLSPDAWCGWGVQNAIKYHKDILSATSALLDDVIPSLASWLPGLLFPDTASPEECQTAEEAADSVKAAVQKSHAGSANSGKSRNPTLINNTFVMRPNLISNIVHSYGVNMRYVALVRAKILRASDPPSPSAAAAAKLLLEEMILRALKHVFRAHTRSLSESASCELARVLISTVMGDSAASDHLWNEILPRMLTIKWILPLRHLAPRLPAIAHLYVRAVRESLDSSLGDATSPSFKERLCDALAVAPVADAPESEYQLLVKTKAVQVPDFVPPEQLEDQLIEDLKVRANSLNSDSHPQLISSMRALLELYQEWRKDGPEVSFQKGVVLARRIVNVASAATGAEWQAEWHMRVTPEPSDLNWAAPMGGLWKPVVSAEEAGRPNSSLMLMAQACQAAGSFFHHFGKTTASHKYLAEGYKFGKKQLIAEEVSDVEGVRVRAKNAKRVPISQRSGNMEDHFDPDLREKVSHETLESLASIASDLSFVYFQRQQWDQAQAHMEYARDLRARVLSSLPWRCKRTDHLRWRTARSKFSESLRHLAVVFAITKRFRVGEKLLNKVLKIDLKLHGAQSPQVATCYNDLGNLFTDESRPAKARMCYMKSLRIRQKVLGAVHPKTAATINSLGTTFALERHHEKALALFRQARRVAELCFGSRHPTTRAYGENLVSCQMDQKASIVKGMTQDGPNSNQSSSALSSSSISKSQQVQNRSFNSKVVKKRKTNSRSRRKPEEVFPSVASLKRQQKPKKSSKKKKFQLEPVAILPPTALKEISNFQMMGQSAALVDRTIARLEVSLSSDDDSDDEILPASPSSNHSHDSGAGNNGDSDKDVVVNMYGGARMELGPMVEFEAVAKPTRSIPETESAPAASISPPQGLSKKKQMNAIRPMYRRGSFNMILDEDDIDDVDDGHGYGGGKMYAGPVMSKGGGGFARGSFDAHISPSSGDSKKKKGKCSMM